MAILCLAEDIKDLKERLSKIIVAYDVDGNPVTAGQLNAVGSMAALLKDAIKPNMVQTLEHTGESFMEDHLLILHMDVTVYELQKWR